jgi:tetratricopeptide (TPR) repeat protein
MPTPRPAPTQTPRINAPRPPAQTPRDTARDNVARRPQTPAPRVITPQSPPTYTRPMPRPTAPTNTRPTTRPTARGDGRSEGTDAAPATPRVPTPRTTTRYDGPRHDSGSRPVSGTITRPSTSIGGEAPTRRVLPTTTPGAVRRGDTANVTRRPNVTDARYAPTRPEATRRPVTTRPATDATRIDPRPSAVRVTERSPSVTSDRASARAGATAPTRRTRDSSAVVTTPAARLVPRSDAPRLGSPRSSSSLVAGATGVARSSSYRSSHRSYSYGNSLLFRSWWDPWCRHGSYYNNCWSWYGGVGAFSWSTNLWSPWIYYRANWWDDCYSYSWYQNWSRPYCASANYWWYPSTTYCPVYLQVPSSVVVVTEPPPAAEPADGGRIVAGGPAMPADVGARGLPADDLAAKYVELGRFYFSANRFAEAADAFGRARSYAPDNGGLHFELADAAFATGDYHYAAFLIAEAVRLDPALAAADADKRDYYGDVKLFDEHLAALERYLASKPYDAQAHLVHGYNLRFSAQPEAAAVAFRRVLEITPENRAAQTFLSALEAAPAEPTDR